jgi:hypothetical protein
VIYPDFYMISDEDCDGEWLGIDDDARYADKARKIPFSKVTVEMMADMLDQDAENGNAHDYCGAHKSLACLLAKHAPRRKIARVFRDLVALGGLHGMQGIAGSGDTDISEEYLGVKLDGGEWKLPG